MPKGISLHAIRGRVERLAMLGFQKPQPILIKWEEADDLCPACGYDIGEHVFAEKLKEAETSDRIFIWFDTWGVSDCPRCGAPNPNADTAIGYGEMQLQANRARATTDATQ